MRYWLTRRGAPGTQTHVKRFDPHHWTVDFPRGTIASLVAGPDPHALTVEAEFLRAGDLVGLIFASEDSAAHPAHARTLSRDYSGCRLAFRWQSQGLRALDRTNGPTLTIEGRDADGSARTWFVRLWNYAQGSPEDAQIALDFDALDAGFALPGDAQRVYPADIDRMFISLVPDAYQAGSSANFAAPVAGRVTMSAIRCDGPGSVLAVGDAMLPENALRMATGYDDMYNVDPARAVDSIERLGHRGLINHYIGMSHYFALDGGAKLDPARGLNGPALAWHRAFARAARDKGFEVIWSLSYEILDMFCPEAWKQRASDQSPAATGYDPPSTLISPASAPAIAFLEKIAGELVALSLEAGLRPRVQIGEPWWWVNADGGICLYDPDARAAFGEAEVAIPSLFGELDDAQRAMLDQAGAMLAASTARIAAAAKAASPQCETLLLVYVPGPMDPRAPDARRANLPVQWAKPAFDVLQLEDYEWVTERRRALGRSAIAAVTERLAYPTGEQHYLAGFAASADRSGDWQAILEAASEARARGVAEVVLWALPQVLRDGLSVFGEDKAMIPFDDVPFPIAIGAEASVTPGFSTAVVTSASGFESRNANWQQARLRFDAGPGVRGDHELERLIAFFRARRGAAVAFRFRDPFDDSSNGMRGEPTPTDQIIGLGDGAATRFALRKSYSGGEERRITRPVSGSVRVAIDGAEAATGWTLEEMGTIQFAAAPQTGRVVTAGFRFDVPVRFAEDRLEINRASFLAGEAPSVPLVEVREA